MKKYTLTHFKNQLKLLDVNMIVDYEKEWIMKSLPFEDFHNFGIRNGYLRFEQNPHEIHKTYFLTSKGFELSKKLKV